MEIKGKGLINIKDVLITVLSLTVLSSWLLAGYLSWKNYNYTVRNDNKLESNILITAAHLGDIEGYTLLKKDEDRDVGYYVKDEIILTTIDSQHVIIVGIGDCVISSSYEGGFTVHTDRKDLIHSGLSGVRVTSLSGKDIGFISSLLRNGDLDCKTLE